MPARSRLAALGASLVLMLGAGGVLTSAAGSPGASSFVPITPCRLLDSRPAPDTVGPRNTPLGPGEEYTTSVWGTNGNCTIPSGATGVAMNVVVALPTAPSFLTVWGGGSRPLAASLNWVADQPPTPNGVSSPLSSTGQLSFFNLAGTVHLIVDVVGYYEPSTSGPQGPQGPQGPAGAKGDAGPPGASGTPNRISEAQIGMLRWDQDPGRTASFPTGEGPNLVAFDGTSIWVTNGESNTVSKINTVTGARSDYTTGIAPIGVAFDGTSIWVANYGSNTVSRIDPNAPASGNPVSVPTGAFPHSVTFDGTNIWVTNSGSNTVSRIHTTTLLRTDFATGSDPRGLVFDGTHIWVANFAGSNISRVDPNGPAPGTPANVGIGSGTQPHGLAFDGTLLWVANWGANGVNCIVPGQLALCPGFLTGAPMNGGIAFDGTRIWVTNWGTNVAHSFVATPFGATYASEQRYLAADGALGIAFDGTSMWVANQEDDTVTRIRR